MTHSKPEPRNPWQTHSTEIKYKNAWITVREDQVTTPTGTQGIYGVVQTRLATGVVALTPQNEIYLVGQYRYPTNMYSWEIPEGGSEPGEDPMEAAKRELKEEAGIIAKNFQQLGPEIHLSNCHSDERAFLYLATDFEEVEKAPDETEQLVVKKVPFADAVRMVETGEIVDAMTIIGVMRARAVLHSAG